VVPGVPDSRQILRVLASQVVASSFSGPLPPAEELLKYEQSVPGLAGRIASMAENQAQHRMALETKVINSDIARSWAGLWVGAVLAALFAVSGFILILNGHDVAGTTVSTGTVATLAGVFVYGTVTRQRERTHKAKVMTGEVKE
jgi:uncharacterized membrane protein